MKIIWTCFLLRDYYEINLNFLFFFFQRWIRVEVIEPVTITAKNFLHLNTSFTTYLIRIEVSN